MPFREVLFFSILTLSVILPRNGFAQRIIIPLDDLLPNVTASLFVTAGMPENVEKKFLPKDSHFWSLRTILDDTLSQSFSSHADRLNHLADQCRDLSFEEKVLLGNHLSMMLSSGYDHERVDGKNTNIVVSPEDLWIMLEQRQNGENAKAGVCRDVTSAITELLMTCGISESQLEIVSYRTAKSGHQVVSIKDDQGQKYTINWSELYVSDDDPRTTTGVNPRIASTSLFQTIHHPRTGRIIDRRRTELGKVLSAISNGNTESADYLPNLIRLEMLYAGTVGLNIFKTTTSRGDEATGVALRGRLEKLFGFFTIGSTVGYVKNEREIPYSNKKSITLIQDIFFFAAEAEVKTPELMLFSDDIHAVSYNLGAKLRYDQTLTFNKSAMTGQSFAVDKNGNVIVEQNGEFMLSGDASFEINYSSRYLDISVESVVKAGVDRAYNTQKADKINLGMYMGLYLQSAYFGSSLLINVADSLQVGIEQSIVFTHFDDKGRVVAVIKNSDNFSLHGGYEFYLTDYYSEGFIIFGGSVKIKMKNGSVNIFCDVNIPLSNPSEKSSIGIFFSTQL